MLHLKKGVEKMDKKEKEQTDKLVDGCIYGYVNHIANPSDRKVCVCSFE